MNKEKIMYGVSILIVDVLLVYLDVLGKTVELVMNIENAFLIGLGSVGTFFFLGGMFFGFGFGIYLIYEGVREKK